jgi:hypothetical protein
LREQMSEAIVRIVQTPSETGISPEAGVVGARSAGLLPPKGSGPAELSAVTLRL